jgi:hypothetical protein
MTRTRELLAPVADPALTVFINCPWDNQFRKQLHAIVFTCVHAGFYPMLATSSGQSGRPRLERILQGLNESRYSIHDLSRCRGEGSQNLARFNMPLELGMAMAIRGAAGQRNPHEYLVLVPDGKNLHYRYISDLGGLDPQTHDGTPPRIVAEVLSWLLSMSAAPAAVKPPEVMGKLARFGRELAALHKEWQGATPPWALVVEVASKVARGV